MAKAKVAAKKKPAAKAGAKRTAAKAANGAPRRPAAAKVPSARDVAAFVGVTFSAPLKADQVRRLKKALPGYVNLLDDVAALIEDDQVALNLDITPSECLRVQRAQKDLCQREAVLEAAYTSAYQQRLQLDDQGIGLLQQVARRVRSRAEENPDLAIRYKSLLDFMGSFSGGGRPAKKPTDPSAT